MPEPFAFLDPGKLVDEGLELVLTRTADADPVRGYVPSYEFEMRRVDDSVCMGKIRLRIGTSTELKYPGHLGYEVLEPFRGDHLAARSCNLLLPLCRAHGLRTLWLTIMPENVASQRTCQLIGAKYIETVRVPTRHEMFAQGKTLMCRYRWDIPRVLIRKVPTSRTGQTGFRKTHNF